MGIVYETQEAKFLNDIKPFTKLGKYRQLPLKLFHINNVFYQNSCQIIGHLLQAKHRKIEQRSY